MFFVQISDDFFWELKFNSEVFDSLMEHNVLSTNISKNKLTTFLKPSVERLLEQSDFNNLKSFIKDLHISYIISYNGDNEVYDYPGSLGNVPPENWVVSENGNQLIVEGQPIDNSVGYGKITWVPNIIILVQ